MTAAVQAKEHDDIMFMMYPRIPFALIVTISISETITDTVKDVSGPHISPPSVMMISFGS